MADRDEVLSDGIAQFNAKPAAWGLAEARALISKAGRSDFEAAIKEEKGCFPTDASGFPVTIHAGKRVCLKHVLEGSRWAPPDRVPQEG